MNTAANTDKNTIRIRYEYGSGVSMNKMEQERGVYCCRGRSSKKPQEKIQIRNLNNTGTRIHSKTSPISTTIFRDFVGAM